MIPKFSAVDFLSFYIEIRVMVLMCIAWMVPIVIAALDQASTHNQYTGQSLCLHLRRQRPRRCCLISSSTDFVRGHRGGVVTWWIIRLWTWSATSTRREMMIGLKMRRETDGSKVAQAGFGGSMAIDRIGRLLVDNYEKRSGNLV